MPAQLGMVTSPLEGHTIRQINEARQALVDMSIQAGQDSRRWFPTAATSLVHMSLGLGGETGEFQNLVKKIDRGDATVQELRHRLHDELADIFTYYLAIADLTGLDILGAYYVKRQFNEARFGQGDTNG